MPKHKHKKGEIYYYPHGEYVREALTDDESDCKTYRVIPVKGKPGRKLLICITDKKGPRGGKTKAVALLRRKDVDLRTVPKKVRPAIKELRKIAVAIFGIKLSSKLLPQIGRVVDAEDLLCRHPI